VGGDTKAKKARSDPKPGDKKRKADEEPAGGWTEFSDTSRAGRRPAGKRGSLLLPEGGPSEPQPGAAAAIDRLDEVDTGDGLFE
jgi:hypothetical protein